MVVTRSVTKSQEPTSGSEEEFESEEFNEDDDFQTCDPAELQAYLFDPRTIQKLIKEIGPKILKDGKGGNRDVKDEGRIKDLEATVKDLKATVTELRSQLEHPGEDEPARKRSKTERPMRVTTVAEMCPEQKEFFEKLTEKVIAKTTGDSDFTELRKAIVETYPTLKTLPTTLIHHHPCCFKEPAAWLLVWETEVRNKFYATGSQIPGPSAQAFHQHFDNWVANNFPGAEKERHEHLRKIKEIFRRLCSAFYDSSKSKSAMDLLYDLRDDLDVAYSICTEIEAAGLTRNISADAAKRFRSNMMLRGTTSSLTMGAAMARIYGQGAK
jgi:hypothetical protein